MQAADDGAGPRRARRPRRRRCSPPRRTRPAPRRRSPRRCRSPICAPGWRRCIPKPWPPDRAAAAAALAGWKQPGTAVVYIADGLTDGADFARFATALGDAGTVTEICCDAGPARLLLPPDSEADRLVVRVAQVPQPIATQAVGAGADRRRPHPGARRRSPCRPAPPPARRRHRAAAGAAQPAGAAGAGGPALGRLGRAAGRALAPPPGRAAGRRPGHRRHAVHRPAVLSAPRARPRSPNCARRLADAAAARPVGADPGRPRRCRRGRSATR